MLNAKIIFEKEIRTITVSYHINDRLHDMRMIHIILKIALENKLSYNLNEDDFNNRSFILSGVKLENVTNALQQIEKLV